MRRSNTTFVVSTNIASYAAAKEICKSQGLAIASIQGEEEEEAVHRLIAEAGADLAYVANMPLFETCTWCIAAKREVIAAGVCEDRGEAPHNPQRWEFFV